MGNSLNFGTGVAEYLIYGGEPSVRIGEFWYVIVLGNMMNLARKTQAERTTVNEGIEGVVAGLVRTVSQVQLGQYSKVGPLTVREVPASEDLSFDHWIASISLGAPSLRFKFRVHFTSIVARDLAASGLGMDKEKITARIGHDFIREYCNLTLGAVKRCLEAAALCDYQMSVPSKKPAYSDVDLSKEVVDAWALRHGTMEIICVSSIAIIQPEVVAFLHNFNLDSLRASEKANGNFVDEILFL